MCFTPWVSLTTAIIELVVATFILVRYRNYLVPVFSAIFIYVLGFYQFSEFMLCVSGNPVFWATVGFVTYTFLPAIGVHMALRFTGIKFRFWTLYLLPAFFILFSILKDDFIFSASCYDVFVAVQYSVFFWKPLFLPIAYVFYYLGFLIAASLILGSRLHRKGWTKIYVYWIAAVMLTFLAPLFLIFILPMTSMQFPSLYCEFALGFTIVAVITSEIYSKNKKREKF